MNSSPLTHWLTTLGLLLWAAGSVAGIFLWLLGRSGFEVSRETGGQVVLVSGGLLALGLLVATISAFGPGRWMRHRYTAVVLNVISLALVWWMTRGA